MASTTRNAYPKSIDAADPSIESRSVDYGYGYNPWPTLSTQSSADSRCSYFCCCNGRFRLSWTAFSVLEILLNITSGILTLFFPTKYLLMILPKKALHLSLESHEWELCEWIVRMYGGMITMQVVLLMAGIVMGGLKTRKTIYWGMLAGDLLMVAIYSSFVNSISSWNPVNLTTIVLITLCGLLRVVVLVFNPGWWLWVPVRYL